MITKDIIIEFFNGLKENEKFDTSDKLLWGYFFLDSDYEKLKKFSQELEGLGYRYVDIFEAQKEDENDLQEYYLHVEKIEYHNADSLDERNRYFYQFAEENKINAYDGFDVGNIINTEKIVK